MSKPEEKERAIELRTNGLSYREIRQQVPVAGSTLSLWLRSVGLAKAQRHRLTEKKLAAGRRRAAKLHAERLERVRRITMDAEEEARLRFRRGDWLWLTGTILYWAEGSKTKEWSTSSMVIFTNMDPRMILTMREWLIHSCGVNESTIHYAVQIHERADIQAAVGFWAELLGLPSASLRVHLKRHNPSPRRKNVGSEYHGTMRMGVRQSTALNYRIAGWVLALAGAAGSANGKPEGFEPSDPGSSPGPAAKDPTACHPKVPLLVGRHSGREPLK